MSTEPDQAAPKPEPEPSGPGKPPSPPKKTAAGFADDGLNRIPEELLEKARQMVKQRGLSLTEVLKKHLGKVIFRVFRQLRVRDGLSCLFFLREKT